MKISTSRLSSEMDLTDDEENERVESKQNIQLKSDDEYLSGTDVYYGKRMIKFANKLIEKRRHMNSTHLDDAIKYKEKLNKMVIISVTLFILSHAPEFIMHLFLLIY